jgi:DNA invertase Pin-like site-specific DNA recombinase
MSVIRDAVETWKRRVEDLEAQIAPLADEAEQLRTAIARLEAIEPASTTGRRTRSAGGAARGAAARRGASKPNGQRAPRGHNRRAILEAIKDEAKTAGDVAKETGIGRPTVSTTLTKLVSDGAAVKAKRGYKAA